MTHEAVKRTPFLHLFLFLLFIIPLLFANTERSIAQVSTPYPPTNTPIPLATATPDPSIICLGNDQGEACYQTSQCTGCLPASYTCQGVSVPINDPSDCGTCYCTSATVTPSNCGPWGNCAYDFHAILSAYLSANRAGCPPVCQNKIVSSFLKNPLRIKSIIPAAARPV